MDADPAAQAAGAVLRKKPVRRVFGRLKGVEASGKIWTIELTKSGIRVRERCHHKVEVVGFERLCCGGGVEVVLASGETFTFTLTGLGLEVRQGSRKPKLAPWQVIANFGRTQMEMFTTLVGGTE